MNDYTLRYRAPDLSGGAFGEFTKATLVETYGLPDTLQIEGTVGDLADFLTPGGGCTFADETGRRFSGPLVSMTRVGDRPRTCILTYSSDLIRLWDRDVWPDGSQAIGQQMTDYDTQTSVPAETAILHYINMNAGPGAYSPRRVPGLVVPASQGRGGTITRTARLDNLGQLVATMQEAASLSVRVVEQGGQLVVTVDTVPDLRRTARYGPADAGGPGLLAEGWTYTLTRPDVTTSIAAGGGEGTNRFFREKSDTAATSTWSARIERIVDQSQSLIADELDQAALDDLSAGAQPVTVSATVLDSPDLRIGTDVPLGAYVSLDLDGELVVDRLRRVTTTISNSSGTASAVVEPVVGSLDADLTRAQKQFLADRSALRKVVTR